jgi:hypothetical protein
MAYYSKLLLLSLLLLLSSPFVAGYAGIGAACQEFNTTTLSSNSGATTMTKEFVCAVHEFYGPQPAIVNGEIVIYGDYQDDFAIIELDEAMNPEQLDSDTLMTLPRTGQTIQVLRYVNSRTCKVSITGTPCTSCAICDSGDETMNIISADCSNAQGGRIVTCEPLEKVFYPILGYTRSTTTSNQPQAPPTSAPVAFCLARGAQCAVAQDCCSGRCVMNKCRASNKDKNKVSQYDRPGQGGAGGSP